MLHHESEPRPYAYRYSRGPSDCTERSDVGLATGIRPLVDFCKWRRLLIQFIPIYMNGPLQIKNVYVVELELDCDAFVASVSRVLQLYPHAAGRLRHYQDTWSVGHTIVSLKDLH